MKPIKTILTSPELLTNNRIRIGDFIIDQVKGSIRRVCLTIAVLIGALFCYAQKAPVIHDVDFTFPSGAIISKTKYDWTDLAQRITANCYTKEDKVRAIYTWLCDNIAYDTSYEIGAADVAIEKGKGVCQAYSEMFYRLGKAVGLDVEIVRGDSKDYKGKKGDIGHVWNVVNLGHGKRILLDATWGAGSVDGRTFTRNTSEARKMAWYDVDPKVLLTSHYPSNSSYQFVSPTLSESEWLPLAYIDPLLTSYGFDANELFAQAKSGELDLPQLYACDYEIVSIPPYSRLQTGEEYKFRVKNPGDNLIVLDGRDEYNDWKAVGNDVYEISFTPKSGEDVHLAKCTDMLLAKSYNYYVSYKVDGDSISSDESDDDSPGFWSAIIGFFKALIQSIISLFK
ncbi:MAG: hypothetical protein HUJ98_03325 [Bacteroidaceae bacterium]|nr:hypothetical protein [Bacteroidaceae bacterium]